MNRYALMRVLAAVGVSAFLMSATTGPAAADGNANNVKWQTIIGIVQPGNIVGVPPSGYHASDSLQHGVCQRRWTALDRTRGARQSQLDQRSYGISGERAGTGGGQLDWNTGHGHSGQRRACLHYRGNTDHRNSHKHCLSATEFNGRRPILRYNRGRWDLHSFQRRISDPVRKHRELDRQRISQNFRRE